MAAQDITAETHPGTFPDAITQASLNSENNPLVNTQVSHPPETDIVEPPSDMDIFVDAQSSLNPETETVVNPILRTPQLPSTTNYSNINGDRLPVMRNPSQVQSAHPLSREVCPYFLNGTCWYGPGA